MARFPEIKGLHWPTLEKDLLDRWEAEDIFQRSMANREGAEAFTFYEGPPTANGRPGIHHVLARTIKDLFCRYKTMQGFRVDRKAGWDTHGLPVEIEVEKKLGLESREQIEAFGIDKYNAACKDSVQQYTGLWNDLTRRIGYWVDMDNPYVTYDNNYIETCWWLLKQLHDKGLLYKGHKIHWYSPGSGTVLSSHEVSLGYKEVSDPSVTVRFPLVGEDNTCFLAWTTTPWTLISNAALAVNPALDYVKARQGDEVLILAAALAGAVLKEGFEILDTFKGADLLGLRYTPLFDHFTDHEQADVCWQVVAADYVTTEDGTGIVHTAPAFGADDYATAQREGLPTLNPVRPDGHFEDNVEPVSGLWFKDADKVVRKSLRERGLLYRDESYLHNYPHDWRKGTPLMSYPVESWFIRTTAMKDRLVALNESINWQPASIGSGRFGNWLENNVDWALSRHRYWGTPLPIWVSDQNPEHIEVIGSIAELREKAGDQVADDASLDLHRPQMDAVTWPDGQGGTMRRVPEIIDVWFDSGAMPFAQWHYPFENKEEFERNFPGDFIAEGLDQTRGWFYTLHAIATLVMDSVAYRNVVVNGLLLDENGEKMSKSKGNTVDPFEAVEQHGADVVRWFLMAANPPWDSLKYSERGIIEARRKLFGTLENVYAFFATYANIDGFDPARDVIPAAQRPELERWILSRLHSTSRTVTEALDHYNPTVAARAIEKLVDDLSNWYVRRRRPVFWSAKKATDVSAEDKRAAYQTTHELMQAIARLMAPIAPFYADWLYRALSGEDSVHLATFPQPDTSLIDPELEHRMGLARDIVTATLSLRNEASLNVRQPLSRILVVLGTGVEQATVEAMRRVILDEINVQAIEYIEGSNQVVSRSAKPNWKLLGKRMGKRMKAAAAAIQGMTDEQIIAFMDSGTVTLDIEGESETFNTDEVDIESAGVEGWLVGREGPVTVALDTTITPELRSQGLAREVINRIQNLRKQADFNVTDRITVQYACEGELAEAISTHDKLICHETLTLELTQSTQPEGEVVEALEVAGTDIRLGLRRRI